MMGARGYPASEPVHKIRITRPFYLGIVPVTQKQFGVWTAMDQIDHANEYPDNPNHPAENMDWQQTRDWCDWLGKVTDAMPEGFYPRLPTEAEWEYACASWQETSVGRVYTDYHTGDGEAALKAAGWYGSYSGGNNEQASTRVVGQCQANRNGLFDMHGNVFEWCLDIFEKHAYRFSPHEICDPYVDETGAQRANPYNLPIAASNADRVIRGGSWLVPAALCRAAFRVNWPPDDRSGGRGFRVGLFPVQSCQQNSAAR